MLKREMYVRMYLSAVEDGLIGELGGDRWAKLCILAAHMDKAGECFPSQQKIAEYLKVSRQAVNKRIKDLLDFRFHGKTVLTLVTTEEGVRRRGNRYRIEPIVPLRLFDSGAVERGGC